MKPEPSFSLTDYERTTPIWVKLNAHMKQRLEYLRAQLEADKSETDTARLRGRIAELKAIQQLSITEPAAPE